MAEILNRVEFAARFKKDLRKAARHPEYADADLEQLTSGFIHCEHLPELYREHLLEKRGVNWAGYWECHLGGDLVVIYRRSQSVVRLHRIGGHRDVFGVQ